MAKHPLRDDLRKLVAEKKVLIIVGSGVSLAATRTDRSDPSDQSSRAASWTGLLQLGVEHCCALDAKLRGKWETRVLEEIASLDLDDMLSAAEKISRKLAAPAVSGEFHAWLRATVGALTLRDDRVLAALDALQVPLATTNYDGLLTQVTGRPPISWDDPAAVSRFLRGDDGGDGILHLHGHWDRPASVVLGLLSYQKVVTDTHAQAAIRGIAMTKSLLFIGCGEGLSDPDFQPFFQWLRDVNAKHEARHYRLAIDSEIAELQKKHPAAERVRLLSYGKNHSDLAGFLADLAPAAPISVTTQPAGKIPRGKTAVAPPPSPPSPAILAHLQRLHDETAKLRLVGIGKGVSIELPIEQAYIPLHVMAQRELADAQPDHFDKRKLAASDGPRDGRGDSRGDGHIELADIFTHAAKHRQRGVILLGDPGAGKTTGARQFCWRTLQGADACARLGLPRDVVPVFLRLRYLKAAHASLRAFICDAVAAPNAPAGVARPGDELFEREAVLWVFDGLDEVVDETTRVKVCQWIEEMRAHRPGDHVLVTSRYQGYQGRVNLGPSFCQFQVRPLDAAQVAEFVAHWYHAVFRRLHGAGAEIEARAEAEIKSLLALLAEPEYRIGRLRELPANPLMLTILCVVHHENHNLPRRRADLYARCVRVLVEHWRQELRAVAGLAPFDPEAAESVLAALAWWLHGEENRVTETLPRLGDEAARALQDLSADSGLGTDGKKFVDRMCDDSGILASFGGGQTGFLHLTFQEYLAGAHAAREGRHLELVARFGNSWWREATLIAVALGSKAFAQAFFAALLARPAWGGHAALVEQCLEEARHVVFEPFLEALRAPKVTAARQVEILRLFTRREHPDLLGVCRELVKAKDREVAALAREIVLRAGGAAAGDATRPRVIAGGEEWVDPRTGIAFVGIPAGEFEMGSMKGADRERPVHRVRVSAFGLGKYAVTNAEYQRYLEATPDAKQPGEWNNSQFNGPQQPVVGVTWHEAQAFAKWAGGRLPTEAEWEYACRAGTQTEYYFGDDEKLLKDYGWYADNTGMETKPVGQKKPNAWGLYDMHGNVWEWCLDGMRTYTKDAQVDPVGSLDDRADRVVRGGSWIGLAQNCRAAYRHWYDPGDHWRYRGLRLAAGQEPAEPQGAKV